MKLHLERGRRYFRRPTQVNMTMGRALGGRRRIRVAVATLSASSLVALTAGCGSSTPSAGTSPTSTSTAPLKSLDIGLIDVSGTPLGAEFDVAIADGYFAREGLKVSLTSLNSASEGVASLSSGHTPLIAESGVEIPQEISSGAVKATAIWGIELAMGYDLDCSDSITSTSQLAGKTIGLSALGTPTELVAIEMLQRFNIPTSEVTFIAGGPPSTQLAGLASGRYACAAMVTAVEPQLAKNHLHVLEGAKVLTNQGFRFPTYVLAASQSYLQSNETEVLHALEALDQAQKYVTNPANASTLFPLIAKYQGGTASNYQASWGVLQVPGFMPQNGFLDSAPFSSMLKAGQSTIFPKWKSVTLSEVETNQYAQKAANALG